MTSTLPCTGPARSRQSERRVLALAVAWSTTWLFALAGLASARVEGSAAVGALAALQLGLGVGLVVAYRQFLRDADELRRAVELEALALGAGVAVAGGFTLALLTAAGVLPSAALLGFFAVPFLVYSVTVSHRMRSYS